MKYKDRALERELNCVVIRTNPDAVDFNIFKEIIYIDTLKNHLRNL